jgi:hypothetical protein
MSIEGTGLFKLFQQSQPHIGILSQLNKMDDHFAKKRVGLNNKLLVEFMIMIIAALMYLSYTMYCHFL